MDDVVAVQTPKHMPPRPPSATGVSGMLSLLQKEWDSLMLGTAEMKRELHRTRQQLSQMLYQYDGACRVIARLTRERDEARTTLRDAQRAGASAITGASVPAAASAAASSSASAAVSVEGEALLATMAAASEALRAQRVARKASKATAAPAAVAAMCHAAPSASQAPHRADRPTITCLDVHPTRPGLVLTGGTDRTAVLFDRDSSAIAATLSAHSKPLFAARFLPCDPDNVILTASSETAKPVCVWTPSPGAAESTAGSGVASAFTAASWSPHTDGALIVALSPHPTLPVVLTAAASGEVALSDLNAPGGPRAVVRLAASPSPAATLSAAAMHVDGVFFATASASSGTVALWDVRQREPLQVFESGCAGATRIAFSENGYHLAIGGTDGVVAVADLRPGKGQSRTLAVTGAVAEPLSCLAFDASGRFLAAGGSKVRVVGVKKWIDLGEVAGAGDGASGAVFGADAKSLVTACGKLIRWHG